AIADAVREPGIAAETPDLLGRGKQLYDAGRYAEAVAVWQQAIGGDVLQKAQSLTFVARAHQALGEWDKAQDAIDRSLVLLQGETLERAGSIVLGQTFNAQGSLYLTVGDAEAALEAWERAEETYRQANDTPGVLGSQIDRAQALQVLGLYQRAKTLLEAVDRQLPDEADTPIKAMVLRSLGTVWQASGDWERAQTLLDRSLAVSQRVDDDPEAIAATLLQLGNLARSASQVRAMDYYDRALATATAPLTRVRARLNQLKLLADAGEGDRLVPLLRAIKTEIDRLPPSRGAVDARVNFAQSLIALQDAHSLVLQKAHSSEFPLLDNRRVAEILAEATQQARQLDDPRAESYAVGMMGQLYERSQQFPEARTLTESALSLAQASQAHEIGYLWQWQLGRIWQQQGNRDRAIAAYAEAVRTLGKLRNDLAIDPERQVEFQGSIEPVYREVLELLLQPGANGDPPAQTDLQQARQTFEALQLAEIDNFFRQACLNVKTRQIDEIDPTAAVFHTILLENRVAVILSLPGQPLYYYQTELPSAQINDILDRSRQSFNRVVPKSIREQLSEQIYDWLVRPAESELAEHHIQTLVFVADGALRNLPMAALYDGDRYLVETYAVANNSGLQLLDPPSPDTFGMRQLQLLGGGLTEARQGFAALPGVKLELEEIQQIVPGQIFLDREFTEANVQTQVDRLPFPIVHLATHGNFGSTFEETFVLTWDEKINAKELETLISTRDAQLRDPIELLVLSACQTASGDRHAVLGLAGIAVRSGARSTLASLWRVQDRSTAELMVAFYQALDRPGISKAEALRQAQLQLLHDSQYAHPFFWSAFVLVGNWL
ncbi:MAG TPA: CHAT domain-containing protein, partial [Oscillatoriales cyanobacterium M4454_W2019_049]|nr:CHAT domain-containing protein [Oscillatoriales cyanobacterium M4454_W2019_049]